MKVWYHPFHNMIGIGETQIRMWIYSRFFDDVVPYFTNFPEYWEYIGEFE